MRLSSMSSSRATSTPIGSAAIRPFREADAPAAAELQRALLPHYVVNAEVLLHWLRTAPARAEWSQWVAEVRGEIVAWADAQLCWWLVEPGIGELWVGVRKDARGQGLGSRLYRRAESHLRELGAWKVQTSVEEAVGQRFAERRGFAETRRERLSALEVGTADLSELPDLEASKRAEGFRLLSLRELLDRPRDLFELYGATMADVPADDPHEFQYEEWTRETLGNPLLDPDAGVVVVHEGRPVSFAFLLVDREGGRAEHDMTGTLREFRGRGLARLVKLAVIRWCADNGITTLVTGNDSTNAAMLAINDRLGYRPTVVEVQMVKELRARPQS
jgi:GNAT superfamily N-acetyltransferase